LQKHRGGKGNKEINSRSKEVSLLAEKLIMNNNINISELHKLAVDEVYATNSSLKNTILNESLKEMKSQNKEMMQKFQTYKKQLLLLKNSKIKEKIVTRIESYEKKMDTMESKLEKFRMKLANDKLKESLNLYEMNLGDDVVDVEKKNLINKIKNVKGDLEIEQSNNVSLRAKILEKEEEIKRLKEEIEKEKMGDKKLVTDEDLIQKNQELTEQVKELEKKKADVEVQIGDIRKRYKFSYNKMNEMKSEMEDMENNLETMSSTVENQRNQLKEKEEEIKKILQEKGKDPEQEKNVEDYQKDLAMENKESERLNSLLEEERYKVKELQKKIVEIQTKLNQALTNEEKTKIQLNLTSQQLRNQDQRKNLLDVRVEKPSEMRPQGRGEILSFRQIDRAGLQNKLVQMKTKSDLDQTLDFKDTSNASLQNTSDVKAKMSVNDSDIHPSNTLFVPNQNTENGDNIPIRNNTTLFNINNINYTTINMINPASKDQEQRPSPEVKNPDISENKSGFPKSTDFMGKLNKSFEVKSKDDEDSSKNNHIALPEFKPEPKEAKKENKSDFKRMYMDSNMTDSDEDSSITSLVQVKSPRNSGADHKKILEKFEMQIKSNSKTDNIQMKNDLNPLPKDHTGNTGNMIIKNPGNSVNSVIEGGRSSSVDKNLTKSLFALKTMSNENNQKLKEDLSLNNELMDQDQTSMNQSDSFDMMFGEKKEIESDEFSNKEINAFEQDEILEKMMKDDVKIGETTLAYSQRIISQNQKGPSSKKPETQSTTKSEEKKELLEVPKNKNLFDQSFQNDSIIGFASNQKEQSLLMVPGQILNNDHSFAGDKIFNTNHSFGGDRNAFISGKSFATNDVTNLLDKIVMDEEQKVQKEELFPKENPIKKNDNLMIVPEEGNIEDDFNFDLPKKMEMNRDNVNKFDSTNSLNLFGDLLNKPKKGEGIDPSIFGTDNFDQHTFNQVLGEREKEREKQKEQEVHRIISPTVSPNESEDEMVFEMKFNNKSETKDQ
jgi:hypothetical protein